MEDLVFWILALIVVFLLALAVAYIIGGYLVRRKADCENGKHVWGGWRSSHMDFYQKRSCHSCGFIEEKKVESPQP